MSKKTKVDSQVVSKRGFFRNDIVKYKEFL